MRRCKLHLRAFFERQKITQAIVLKLQLGHFLEAGIEFVVMGFQTFIVFFDIDQVQVHACGVFDSMAETIKDFADATA
ncbi:hypothetical protein D3C87_1298200 [compost metagenome]